MTDPQPLGRLLDSLGVQHRPQDGELVLGAVVLLKVMEPDGEVSMRSAWSPGLSWMERVGMHSAAAQTDMPGRGGEQWYPDLDQLDLDTEAERRRGRDDGSA